MSFDQGMLIMGPLIAVWGVLCAVFNERAAAMMKRVQSVWGQWAVDMVTPRYARFLGICLAIGGTAFFVAALILTIRGVHLE